MKLISAPCIAALVLLSAGAKISPISRRLNVNNQEAVKNEQSFFTAFSVSTEIIIFFIYRRIFPCNVELNKCYVVMLIFYMSSKK